MNIKQMRDWLNSIPEELNDKEIVYREVTKSENEDELQAKDVGISAGNYDPEHQELCIYNSESYTLLTSLHQELQNQKEV